MTKPRLPITQPDDTLIRLVPLTQGQVAIVDADRFAWASQWYWHAVSDPRTGTYYAVRGGRRGEPKGYLHRQLMNEPDGVIDFVNRNTLDCRIKNLCSRPVLTQPDDPSIRLIALTQGQVAVIDAGDYERVAARDWNAHWNKNAQSYYAQASGGLHMHRFILSLTDPAIQCDHRNGDTLDNRKANLRAATSSQNCQNRKPRKDCTSGTPGVCWDKRYEKWQAKIGVKGRRIFLGRFADINDAIKARKAAEEKYFGDFAYARREHLPPKKPPVSDDGAAYTWHSPLDIEQEAFDGQDQR